MKIKLLLSLFLSCVFYQMNGQGDSFWLAHSSLNKNTLQLDKAVLRPSFPKYFTLYDLNIDTMRSALFANLNKVSNQRVVISLPNAEGQIEQFEISEASNFEPDLQAQFPEIRAYSGKGLTDKFATLKLSISPQGIQTMVFRTNKPNEFIEPYSGDHTVYAVFKSNRTKGRLAWSCTTEEKEFVAKFSKQIPESTTARFSDTTLRTLRLAQSCNAEYANYFGATSSAQVGLVLSAFNATLTRCNGVYERDLGLHLNLVASSTNIIYYNPSTDPYSTTLSQWNTQLQKAISTTLTGTSTSLAANNAAYDIGHMFGASGGGGNAGCIGCVCVNAVAAGTGSTKGRGITSPADGVPTGDNFDVDYVVHEIGHQLGGTHTFSNSNEGSGTNMEVGSGITIMGYAGITPNDVAPHSIDKYHAVTIAQIQANLQTKSCAVTTNISANNSTPTVNAGLDYVIPASTNFVLTAVGADANANDALTYSWEQFDDGAYNTGAASSASPSKTVGPNFISWDATTAPQRYFPKIESIIANSATTDQDGGDAGMLSEALSAVDRNLNFRVTVRDNVPYSSVAPIKVAQTNFDDTQVKVAAAAGPFVVTSPNTSISWVAGTNQNVTWSVEGTDAYGINSSFVDIYLSLDGGYTYPIQLANKVPNDGSEVITVPNNLGSNNRIMVKGNNNVFFDISNAPFSITGSAATFAVEQAGVQTTLGCTVSAATFNFNYTAIGGFSGVTTFRATGLPSGATALFSPATASTSGQITLTVNNLSGISGRYAIIVAANSGGVIKNVPFYLNLGLGQPTLLTPSNNAVGQYTSVILNWANDPNASAYDVQVSTAVNFSTLFTSTNVSSNSYNVTGLAQGTEYYWRIAPKNATCATTFGTPFKFTTGLIACGTVVASTNVPLTISDTGTPTVNSVINIANSSSISDVKVSLNITHTYLSDLFISLTSPSGTTAILLANACTSNSNVNATFDDNGSAVTCNTSTGTTTYAVSGIVLPASALAVFTGQNSAGTWTLRVSDGGDGDGGTINSWSLGYCVINQLGLESKNFQNFTLFPNPNNGQFTIRFTSDSAEPTSIMVNDLSGRQVFVKNYENSTVFDQDLNLDFLQSGVYLVTVGNGLNKIVKKIIIK